MKATHFLIIGGSVLFGVSALVAYSVRDIRASVDGHAVAEAMASELRSLSPLVGPVTQEGGVIRFDEVQISLAKEPEKGDPNRTAHYHARVRMPGAGPEGIEVCLVGLGLSPAEAERNVGASFRQTALPAVLSMLRNKPLLGARPFSGTEEYGVPGYRGFAGPVMVRGTHDAEGVDEEGLYSGVLLPTDGQVHVLKVVLAHSRDGWKRTVELDGDKTDVTDYVWDSRPPPPGIVMAVAFAAFQKRDTMRNKGDRAKALAGLAAHEPWLFTPERCPADVMPAEISDVSYSREACTGGRLLNCIDECQHGSGVACYSAALELQGEEVHAAEVRALFLRACQLGHPSGCTNAAAEPEHVQNRLLDTCAMRTFEATCKRGPDPWGCTMYAGGLLSRSDGGDVAEARTALEKSCLNGADDPACVGGKRLLEELARRALLPADGGTSPSE